MAISQRFETKTRTRYSNIKVVHHNSSEQVRPLKKLIQPRACTTVSIFTFAATLLLFASFFSFSAERCASSSIYLSRIAPRCIYHRQLGLWTGHHILPSPLSRSESDARAILVPRCNRSYSLRVTQYMRYAAPEFRSYAPRLSCSLNYKRESLVGS